ncbi:MAG: M23 family metallopeptidase [Anaerolineales bacterium]|jgi:murein DD-endopeptidase MepM/ murein hydrolase activator NlpD
MANYNYDLDLQPEKAIPYTNGGCFSGFLIIPLTVIIVSAVLFYALSHVTFVSSASSLDTGIGGSPTDFVSPYNDYTLTQGVHGMSYGHMAIDIAAGKGATIYSPIYGEVTELFIDGIGNPTLVIENEVYRVTMLHGEYSVQIGENINAGEPVGIESNLGNTTDMQGNSCRNRDCGYHTHLNVFDKRIGANINPLNLLEP